MKVFYLTMSTDCGIEETQTDLYLNAADAADDALEMVENYSFLEDMEENKNHLRRWVESNGSAVELVLYLDECGLILGNKELWI